MPIDLDDGLVRPARPTAGRQPGPDGLWSAGVALPAPSARLSPLQRLGRTDQTGRTMLALQRSAGNDAASRLVPGPQAGVGEGVTTAQAPGSGATITEFVTDQIRRFAAARQQWRDWTGAIPKGQVDQQLNTWYDAVVMAEKLLAFVPGERDLHEALRDAYLALLRAAASKMAAPKMAAKGATASPAKLERFYRANRGRIPMWAWPQPHELIPGYSAPLPVGGYQVVGAWRPTVAQWVDNRMRRLLRGSAPDYAHSRLELTVNGVQVAIYPDKTNMSDLAEGTSDAQRKQLEGSWALTGALAFAVDDGTGAPFIRIEFRCFYPPWRDPMRRLDDRGIRPGWRDRGGPAQAVKQSESTTSPFEAQSGLTAADVAGSLVTPYSGSAGFHEGQHVLYVLDHLAANPPPKPNCQPGPAGFLGRQSAEYVRCVDAWWEACRDHLQASYAKEPR